MRRTVVEVLALVLLATGGGLGWGQQPAREERPRTPGPWEKASPAKSKLEEMLAQALKNNLDIRVAEAKVSEAEAELNRTRLLVLQKVLGVYHAIESQRAEVEYRQKRLERMNELRARGSIDARLLEEAQKELTREKAKLAAAEAELPYLLGKQPAAAEAAVGERRVGSEVGQLGGTYRVVEAQKVPARAGVDVDAPAAEKIRRALEKRITLHLTDKPPHELVKAIQEQVPEFHINISGSLSSVAALTIHLKNVPLSTALELLQDSLPGMRIVIRSYGFLITSANFVPPGAVLLNDFIRQAARTDREKGKPSSGSGKNPPAK